MKLIIRKAQLNEAVYANTFLTKLIQDEKQYDKNINQSCIVTTFYENLISNEDNCILFAIIDNVVVGYLYGYIKNNGDACIDVVAQLDALYVEEEYRKNGIGDQLIKSFKSWSKDKNVKYIEVNVCGKNESAIRLYKKHGFDNIKITMNIELD